MFCAQCNSDLRECVCPDFKERIDKLRGSKFLAIDWDSIVRANDEFRARQNPPVVTEDSPPTMTCDWCGKVFPADARACVEAGLHTETLPEEGEEWKGPSEPLTMDPAMIPPAQREEMKARMGLTDAELDQLLTTGSVEGLGGIVCVQCQDEAAAAQSE